MPDPIYPSPAVYRGYSEPVLRAHFESVEDPSDWRGPIAAHIEAIDRDAVEAAVEFYTSTTPVFAPLGSDIGQPFRGCTSASLRYTGYIMTKTNEIAAAVLTHPDFDGSAKEWAKLCGTSVPAMRKVLKHMVGTGQVDSRESHRESRTGGWNDRLRVVKVTRFNVAAQVLMDRGVTAADAFLAVKAGAFLVADRELETPRAAMLRAATLYLPEDPDDA